jgi:hypothetical protein
MKGVASNPHKDLSSTWLAIAFEAVANLLKPRLQVTFHLSLASIRCGRPKAVACTGQSRYFGQYRGVARAGLESHVKPEIIRMG